MNKLKLRTYHALQCFCVATYVYTYVATIVICAGVAVSNCYITVLAMLFVSVYVRSFAYGEASREGYNSFWSATP